MGSKNVEQMNRLLTELLGCPIGELDDLELGRRLTVRQLRSMQAVLQDSERLSQLGASMRKHLLNPEYLDAMKVANGIIITTDEVL